MEDSYAPSVTSPLGKLRIAILAVLFVVVGGTLGLMYLEEMTPIEALYMVVITLSTVGFGEVRQLHDSSRIFVMFLIIFGVGLGGFMVTILGEYLLEGQFKDAVARRRMSKQMKKLKDHFIIAGYGRVGRQVVEEFRKRKVSFVVVEKDPKSLSRLASEGILHYEGDATDDDVLREVGIDSARTLVSTLPDEALNVYLTLTARQMNSALKIIARADFEEGEKKLRRAGADHVVIPHVIGGSRMAMASLRPNVVDFMQMAAIGEEGLSLEEVVIPVESSLVGKSVLESNLKRDYGVTIIGIKHPGGKMLLNPEPQTVLEKQDIMILIGRSEKLEDLTRSLSL